MNLLDRQIIAVLIEPIKADLKLSDTAMGILTGLGFAVAYSLFSIPAGWIADRVDRSRMIGFATLIWSVMCGLSGMAGSFGMLLLTRIGVAVGEAGALPPTHSLISEIYPPHRRGAAIGIVQVGAPLGVMIAFVVGGLLAGQYGWRTVLMLAALPGLLVALLVFAFLRDPRAARLLATDNAASRGQPSAGFVELLRIRSLRWTLVGGSFCAFASYAAVTWLVSLVQRDYGWSAASAGATIGPIFGLLGIVGTVAGGLVGGRWERSRRGGQLLVVACAVAGAAALMSFALSGVSSALFIALIAVSAPLMSAFQGPLAAQIQNIAPETSRARASSIWVLTVNLVGIGLGPTLVGVASDLLQPAFGDAALRAALGLVPLSLGAAAVALLIAARGETAPRAE